MPFKGKLPRAEALQQLAALQAGILTRQTGPLHSGYPPMAGDAAPRQSFLEQKTGKLILSALKPAEDGDGLIVRLWNPTRRKQTETLTLWRKIQRAAYVGLNEDPVKGKRPTVRGRRVTVEAKAGQIVTLRLTLA